MKLKTALKNNEFFKMYMRTIKDNKKFNKSYISEERFKECQTEKENKTIHDHSITFNLSIPNMLIPYSTDVEEYHKITIKYLKYINKSIIKHIVNATALYCEKSKNIKTTYYKKQKHIEYITEKYKEYLNKCEQENNFAETINKIYNLIKPFYSIKKNEFVQLCKTKVVTKS
jgi:hypothetical protein